MSGTRRGRTGPKEVPDRREAVRERRQRAAEEPLDLRVRARLPYPVLAVRNPLHGTEYRVLWPTFPARDVILCTCTDFARRGLGTCKHIEAVLRWFPAHEADEPELARRSKPKPLPWRTIDRAIAVLVPGSYPPSVTWRKPGRLLFEPRS
jgi:hypothetical protein